MLGRLKHQSTNGLDLLVVCTANICRSPYIAGCISHGRPDLKVQSAGTAALVGNPVDPKIIDALCTKGVVVDTEATAHALTTRLTRSATMIVTATHQHRLAVIDKDKSAEGKTFTLKELARLSVGLPSGIGLDGLVAAVGAALAQPSNRDFDDDLADPFGESDAAYNRMVSEADAAVAGLLHVL